MQRTSDVGLCRAAQQAAIVARDPPMQKPVMMILRGSCPLHGHGKRYTEASVPRHGIAHQGQVMTASLAHKVGALI